MLQKNQFMKKTDDNKPIKHLKPATIFIFAYATYNLLGLINFPWLITDAYDKSVPWTIFIAGLLGLLMGNIFWSRIKPTTLPKPKKPFKGKPLGFLFFSIFVICLLITIINSKGVPLLLGEGRFENSAVLFNAAQIYGFWVFLKALSSYEAGRKIKKAPIIIYAIGILMFGYRSPILTLALVLTTYLICFKLNRIKAYRISMIGAFLLITLSSIFSGYRVSQDHDTSAFFKNVDMDYVSKHSYIAPLVPALSMFNFSQETISTAAKNLKEPMYGELFLSNYKAFLPGSHWGARNTVGELVGARWVNGRPMSITPTLQGALFIDFGVTGVFIGAFLIIGIIGLLKRHADRGGALEKLIFCYFMTLSIMSIHNGYWDITFLFLIMFALSIFIYKRIYPPHNLKNHQHSHKILQANNKQSN